MVSRRQGIRRHLLRHQERPHGHAAAQGLGSGHDVRLHAVALPGEHMACPAHAALNLVQYQQDVLFFAEGLYTFQEFLGGRHQAALALDSLQDDCARLVVYQFLYAGQVVHPGESDVPDHGFEGLAVLGGAGDGQSSEGPAVEGMLHGYDLMVRAAVLLICVLAGSLDGPFDSLRAGIGEEHPVHAGDLLQLLRRPDSGHVVVVVGGVDHLVDLAC